MVPPDNRPYGAAGAEGIEVLIEDDGPGIPEQDRGEAIQSGGRLDTSKPGTGLGLAIANRSLAGLRRLAGA